MRIKNFSKFNEKYDQLPKENWTNEDSNYYTFSVDLTVKAETQEEAEDKMEVIANNPDFDLGSYKLTASTIDGVSSVSNTSSNFNDDEILPHIIGDRF